MAYDVGLADRLRDYFHEKGVNEIIEKKMFGGLAFMINGKMCVNASMDRLMCRFDHDLTEELSEKNGFRPMVMKDRIYKGYCYVEPDGYDAQEDFEFWVDLCLAFNAKIKD